MAAELPNFHQVAAGLRLASDHLERCQDLPAIDGGQRLGQLLNTLLERFTALETTMRRRFDQVDARLDDLNRRVAAS